MDITFVTKDYDFRLDALMALASGAAALGLSVHFANEVSNVETRVVATWGWKRGSVLRSMGHEVLLLEHGYLGDRHQWFSLAWNGLNGLGKFGACPDDSRFNQHFSHLLRPMRPELRRSGPAMIVGQVNGDMSLRGMDMKFWYEVAAEKMRRLGYEPFIRNHPVSEGRGQYINIPGLPTGRGPLDSELERSSVVVTWNSNTGVDALLAGVHTYACDPGSMVWHCAEPDLNQPAIIHHRDALMHSLAWKQWTMDEFSSGVALQHLLLANSAL